MKLSLKKVWAIYNEIDEKGLFEDRREYDQTELMTTYDLNIYEAKILHSLIQEHFEPDVQNCPSLGDIPAGLFKEYIRETVHNGFEGFEGLEPALILLINDLRRYYMQQLKGA